MSLWRDLFCEEKKVEKAVAGSACAHSLPWSRPYELGVMVGLHVQEELWCEKSSKIGSL